MNKRQEQRSLLLALFAVVAVIAIYFLFIGDFNTAPRRRVGSTPRPSTEGVILARASGTGTEVLFMDVPELCFSQRLDYVGNRIESDRAGSVKFVVMQDIEEVRVTGPTALERAGDTRGVGVWSLDDGQGYTLTVYGTNAAWNLLVRCD